MSSSSVTAGSRSPSPSTPESRESKLFQHTLQSWCQTLPSDGVESDQKMWTTNPQDLTQVLQKEEHEALSFHDLIQEQMFDDINVGDLSSSYIPPVSPAIISAPTLPQHQVHVAPMSDVVNSYRAVFEATKPVPPPTPVQHISNLPHKVVYPSKETCFNLPIIIPSIPESGTKSRVETQIRLIVDLAHASTSSGPSFKYDRVGSWKYLKLPDSTSTKKRTRKEGKLDVIPQETLHLSAEVTCASPPHMRVATCSSCQAREAKRAARKVAARVRPLPSDSDCPEATRTGKTDVGFNLIQFNCPQELDFSGGSVILPMRITCYCRHHREKVGFNVHFKMMDHTGRVVGSGTTPPIMITDDHKSTNKSQALPHTLEATAPSENAAGGNTSSRKPTLRNNGTSKKRPKPYDGPNASGRRLRKELDSASSSLPPSVTNSSVPTRSSSPSLLGTQQPTPAASNLPSPSASFDSVASPTDFVNGMYNQSDVPMPDFARILEAIDHSNESSHSSIPTPPESVCSPGMRRSVAAQQEQQPVSLFFGYDLAPPPASLPPPKIHRLIPASGPTHGGIEVTVLGANFYSHVQLNCLFGDAMASSTQRWSDNTIVCVLPARTSPGVVAVWFDGVEKHDDGTPPCLFTYTDESDRVLMELALQVVGMKLNGKLEDARSVAMRIIGTSGPEGGATQESTNSIQYLSTAVNSLLPLLAGNDQQFERLLIDFLSILDAEVDAGRSVSSVISHQATSGQTLLHLAAFLKFPNLVSFLVRRGIDIDLRDRNGYTALHFAAFVKSTECARVLIESGASEDIVDVLGRTPAEIASTRFFDDLLDEPEDEEATWGDIEDEEEEEHTRHARSSRKRSRNAVCHATEPVLDAKEVKKEEVLPDNELPFTAELIVENSLDDTSGLPTDKATASIIDLIQRTIAQLQHPQDIIPNVAQLPLLQLPDLRQLPGMGVVPWNALPQMPAVFPVFVPIPAWSSFWSDKREEGGDVGTDGQATNQPKIGSGPQLRAIWEKLVQNATGNYRAEAPPPYQERATDAEGEERAGNASGTDREEDGSRRSVAVVQRAGGRQSVRRVNYEDMPVPEQEVNAYGYRPLAKQSNKMQKKHDRMLILFWIPILFIGFVWIFLQSIWACFGVVKDMIPARAWMRV